MIIFITPSFKYIVHYSLYHYYWMWYIPLLLYTIKCQILLSFVLRINNALLWIISSFKYIVHNSLYHYNWIWYISLLLYTTKCQILQTFVLRLHNAIILSYHLSNTLSITHCTITIGLGIFSWYCTQLSPKYDRPLSCASIMLFFESYDLSNTLSITHRTTTIGLSIFLC